MENSKISQEERKRRKKRNSWIIFWILVGIRIFAVEHYMVPSSSMTPTLITGDIILIKKYAFAWNRKSVPFGGYLPYLQQGFVLNKPKHGQVAVFTLKRDPATYYVKRIVGLEGDKVQMKNGVLHINGKAAKMELVGDYKFLNDNGDYETGKKYKVTLPTGKSYYIYRNVPFGAGGSDNTNEYTVPKGHVWLQGDFNTGSADSFAVHFMGPIAVEELVGVPFFALYNTNSRMSIDGAFSSWILQLPWRIVYALWKTNFNRVCVSVE